MVYLFSLQKTFGESTPMMPIFHQRIDYTVYKQLLHNIKSGRWTSGEKLPSEGELSKTLKVGRVSVRSALQRLQALGYIETVRGKGSFVCGLTEYTDPDDSDQVSLSKEEYLETTEWREMLENAAIENLLAKTEAVDFSQLTEAYTGMLQAAETMDIDAYTKFDHRFHMSLILATGNDKFIRNAQIFREDLYLYLKMRNKQIYREGRDEERVRHWLQDSLAYHKNLHDALTAKDAARAKDIRKKHTNVVSARFDFNILERSKREKLA